MESNEVICPFILLPCNYGPRMHIVADAKATERERQRDMGSRHNDLRICKDDGGIKGDVGAVAVCSITGDTKQVSMGRHSISTAYTAELSDIILALEYGRQRKNKRDRDIIHMNSQAAIQTKNNTKKSGACLLEEIL